VHVHAAHLVGEHEKNIGLGWHAAGFCLKWRGERNELFGVR
jgi:hypothetical protein